MLLSAQGSCVRWTQPECAFVLCVWLWGWGIVLRHAFQLGTKLAWLTGLQWVHWAEYALSALYQLPNNCMQSKYLNRLSSFPSNAFIILVTMVKNILAVRQNNMQNINFQFREKCDLLFYLFICTGLMVLSEKQSCSCAPRCCLKWGMKLTPLSFWGFSVLVVLALLLSWIAVGVFHVLGSQGVEEAALCLFLSHSPWSSSLQWSYWMPADF